MAERITQLIRAATGGDKPARGRLRRFAEQIPTSSSTVTRWRGGTVPDAEWWPALARVLNVSETEIAEASDQSSGADVMSRLTRLERMVSDVLDVVGQRDEKFGALSDGIAANHSLLEDMVPILRELQGAPSKPPSSPPKRPSGHTRSAGRPGSRSDGAHTPHQGVRRR